MMEHAFTATIMALLQQAFGEGAMAIYTSSPLLRYVNLKTKSAVEGSKARGSFANLYAIYVLVEDYQRHGFAHAVGGYAQYEGARYTDLLNRQRTLPFGRKLQNHALNHRLNEEFRRYFPDLDVQPILRDVQTNRYWFNENLLWVEVGGSSVNLAGVVLGIIDAYVQAKRDALQRFLATCDQLQHGTLTDDPRQFIEGLLAPNTDARIFELVSYAILKYAYYDEVIYWGYTRDTVQADALRLYKTGRTNANDGGIDFVLRPVGRFFQVTETTDVAKYFLDIDKVERYPITFVVKSTVAQSILRTQMRARAEERYPVQAVVERYMASIEEIVNIPQLLAHLETAVQRGHLGAILDELIHQSKVEFHLD